MADTDAVPVQVALNRAKAGIGAVGKTGRNTQQNYDFRGVDAVVNAAAPLLNEHGVIVMPRVLSHNSEEYTTKNGTRMRSLTIEVEYTFTGPAGDSLVCTVLGESSDSGDKVAPKAMSVAYRIALLQVLNLPTDDPDPDASSHERAAPGEARQPERVPAEAAQLQARYDALPEEFRAKMDDWVADRNEAGLVRIEVLPSGWWEKVDGLLTKAEAKAKDAAPEDVKPGSALDSPCLVCGSTDPCEHDPDDAGSGDEKPF